MKQHLQSSQMPFVRSIPRDAVRLLLACLVLVVGWTANAGEPPNAEMDKRNTAFFKSYCIGCHGAEEQNGKVRLDTIPFEISQDLPTADTWQKILNALNAGEMPPEGEPQPTNAEKAEFLGELSEKVVFARKVLSDTGGAPVMRRLNQREYQNTIRDLLGVTIDVSALPRDAGGGNFDTVGASLYFSPAQLEMYLQLARRALDAAIISSGESPPTAERTRTEVEEWANPYAEKYIAGYRDGLERNEAWMAAEGEKPATEFGFQDDARARRALKLYRKNAPYYDAFVTWRHTDRGTYLSGLHSEISARLTDAHPPGRYTIRLCIGATDEAPSERRFIEFGIAGDKDFQILSTHQVTGTIDEPQVIEVPLALRETGSRAFQFRELRPDHEVVNWKKDPVVPDPVLWVDWVEVEGPTVDAWPPESHRRIFFASPAEPDSDYARDVIARFAERAFRGRKPSPEFLDRLVGIYEYHRSSGAPFEDAVKEALVVVLASPGFLYLSEQHTDASGSRLNGLELATRLSYFLWSAPPDEELLADARDGSLHQPDVLAHHVDRMLDDPKSWEFVTGFTHQWLDLDRLGLFQFDKSLYPDFVEGTKLAARDEVYHFFDTLLRGDLSAKNFVESDFVVVNGLMAEYYGLEGVTGDAWRKVPLPESSVRGGVLGMAAILAMGSDGERTSPVERGAFVLRKILNDPPPPAPANVPQLSRLDDEQLTVREKLGIHQEDAQCMHCHRKIDPIGFGLESFNAAGLWRTEEPVFNVSYTKGGKRKISEAGTQAIDASGAIHKGPEFDGYFELRDILASRIDDFSRGLIEAMLEYALGRTISFSDEETIAEIHEGMQRDDYSLRSLVHVITQSKAFKTR